MIKPILYHDIQEKSKIEAQLVSEIAQQERSAMWHALMNLFANINSLPITGDRSSSHSPSKKNE